VFADVADIRLRPEQVEIPVAVGRVPIEDCADQPVVPDDETLVDPPRGVAQDDVLAFAAARNVGTPLSAETPAPDPAKL